jgi:hypothetical protein
VILVNPIENISQFKKTRAIDLRVEPETRHCLDGACDVTRHKAARSPPQFGSDLSNADVRSQSHPLESARRLFGLPRQTDSPFIEGSARLGCLSNVSKSGVRV